MSDKIDSEPVVSCMNYNTMLKYLKHRYGDITFILDRYEHSEEYISDPNHWISWESARRLLFLIKKFLNNNNPRLFYEIGVEMHRLRSVGTFEQLVRLFPSPKSIVLRIPDFNKRFNHIFDMHISDVTSSSAMLLIYYEKKFRETYIYDMCFWNQGIVASIPRLWDLPEMEIKESQCTFTLEEVIQSYAYLGLEPQVIEGRFLVNGEECAVRVSNDDNGNAFLATRDLIIDGITVIQNDMIYGSPFCQFTLHWQNKSFFRNLYDLTSGRLRGDPGSAKALRGQLEYTEKQFFEIQRLHKELQAYTDDLEKLVKERTKQLEEEQAARLEAEKYALVGRLSFGVGHDLRNTIATAINSGLPQRNITADLRKLIDLLLEKKPQEEIDEFLQTRRIEKRLTSSLDLHATMMSSLNKALENVKALEGYTVQDGSDFQEIRIEDVIEKVLHDHRQQLQGIRLELNYTDQEYSIQGNPLKLYDVFQNLIGNAIEAMEKVKSPVLKIVTQVAENDHVTMIEDNGQGMSEDIRKHIFEPFYSTKEIVDGRQRGLGLFNVWRLIEQHAGEIAIESVPDQFTRFTIKFRLE